MSVLVLLSALCVCVCDFVYCTVRSSSCLFLYLTHLWPFCFVLYCGGVTSSFLSLEYFVFLFWSTWNSIGTFLVLDLYSNSNCFNLFFYVILQSIVHITGFSWPLFPTLPVSSFCLTIGSGVSLYKQTSWVILWANTTNIWFLYSQRKSFTHLQSPLASLVPLWSPFMDFYVSLLYQPGVIHLCLCVQAVCFVFGCTLHSVVSF